MADQSEWEGMIRRADNMPPGYGVGSAAIKAAQKISAELDALRGTMNNLSVNMASQTGYLKKSISDAAWTLVKEAPAIEQRLDKLSANIKDFSESTSALATQANRLTRWYVILTCVIAIATVVSLLKGFGLL